MHVILRGCILYITFVNTTKSFAAMKNKLFFVCMLLLGACAKDMQPPTIDTAQETLSHRVSVEDALRQLDNVLDILDTPTRGEKRTVREVLAHSPKRTRSGGSNSIPDTLLYIVNFDDDQGYAILAADSRLEPVLALIDCGVYEPSENYADETGLTDADLDEDEKDEFWCNGPLTGTFRTIEIIEDYADGYANPPYTKKEYGELIRQKQVGPYIQTKWGQGDPYNRMCNGRSNITFHYDTNPNNNNKAGCVAIALAQILAYHQYPKSAYDHTYDWSKITNTPILLSYDSTTEIPHLIRAAGISCRTNYGKESSSSTAYRAKKAMKNIFGYSGTNRHLSFADKNIRDMLDNDSPVLVTGKPKRKFSGHAWVIDGYIYGYRKVITEAYSDENYTELISTSEENEAPTYYYHCNFGWHGDANGYYLGKVFDTVAGPIDREKDVDNATKSDYDYRWFFRTVTYNNPNKL